MRPSRGFTLIELVLLVMVFAVGLAGVITVYVNTVQASAEPQVRKQAMAIAESMMEEIMLQPFTSTTPAGATRSTFGKVDDYIGYTSTGVVDVYGAPVAGLAGYNVAVSVVNNALGPVASQVPAASSRKITVTVTRGAFTFSLQSYRVGY